MFMIPGWIANILFLVTCYVSAFQHVQLKRINPVKNLQFFMMAFSLTMLWLNVMYGYETPWRSLAFFLTAVGGLGLMIYQFRRMPAKLPFV